MFTVAMYIPVIFLPDAMFKEDGISHIKAGSIITVYGSANLAGRLISAIITHYSKNRGVLYTSISMLALGSCCLGMAISNLYWQFVICAFIYGLFVGNMYVLLPIALVEMFGIESLKDSYGVTIFFSGVSTMLGSPLAGWLKVLWGTYDIAFFMVCGFYLVGWIVSLVLLWVQDRKRKQYNSIH